MRPAFLAIALLLMTWLVVAQQPSATQPGKKEPEKCTVQGVVLSAKDGLPLKKARITLRNTDPKEHGYYTITAADGLFVFEAVDPGRYDLSVSRNGYVPQRYGQQGGEDSGTILALAPGQRMKDMSFHLILAGAISGRLTDEDGASVPRTTVQALRFGYEKGKRELKPAADADTDDRGEYRIFDLAPGRYYLRANGRGRMMVFDSNPEKYVGDPHLRVSYAPIFYPRTADPAQGVPVEVTAGGEVPSVDFLLLPSQTYQVRGKVFNAMTSKPGQNAMLLLLPRSGGAFRYINQHTAMASGDQGTFEIQDVPAGSYILTATWRNGLEFYTARIPVDIGDADVEGLRLVIAQGVDLPGRASVEGKGPAALGETRVMLRSEENLFMVLSDATVNPDGTFVIKNVSEGEYEVFFRNDSPDFYWKSARLAGEDVLAHGLIVSRGGTRGALEITLGANGGRVEGQVLRDESLPANGANVVLVPDPPRREQSRWYKSVTTDQYGRFIVRGIAPGDYKVFAWQEAESGAWEDPTFLKPFEEKGSKVHVEEAARQIVALKLIPTKPPAPKE